MQTESTPKVYIGNHLSSSAGFLAMGKHATKLGANTFAFFTRNPRGGKAKEIKQKDADALCSYLKENHFGPLVAHAPYTMNLCSDKADIREFAKNMLLDDLQVRMEVIPGNYYNFHPGSHVGQGTEKGIQFITAALNEALFEGMHTTVLLETMAGKGSEVGSRFEELRQIIDGVKLNQYMGVCLDTCHIWDGGYNEETFDDVLDEFDRIIGLERLKALHLNDSMNSKGARKDRHQKLGQGEIGLDILKQVVTNPRVKHLPLILETPNEDEGYAEEIALVKSWF
ncbi:MAG: deoxyribonuclease IV [Lachnospiraceae bacterium]|nr:deoxyribonuclease IV [Lachnospiraceae bacterium]